MKIRSTIRECIGLLVLFVFGSLTLSGQTPPKKPEQQPMGGASTGTPLTYATRRTAGITDPKAPVVFEDITDKTALKNFLHRSGTPEKNYIFEVPSGVRTSVIIKVPSPLFM